MGILCSSSDTSISTTTDDIDTVIAKKREVINIKKSRQKFAARNSRTGNGRVSSQDSGEYIKQTIESAREALISTSESEADSADELLSSSANTTLDNPPNSEEAEVDNNMQREILEALKTDIQQNENNEADSSDTESDTDQTTRYVSSM